MLPTPRPPAVVPRGGVLSRCVSLCLTVHTHLPWAWVYWVLGLGVRAVTMQACVAADHVNANAAATAAANAAAGGSGGSLANPNAVFATLGGATAPSRGGGGTRTASAFATTTGAQRSETAARLRMQHSAWARAALGSNELLRRSQGGYSRVEKLRNLNAAWRDAARRGVAWRGVAWRGVAWRGVARLLSTPSTISYV